jgi:ATP-dependent Clp protease ATP-binding subunit ClpA
VRLRKHEREQADGKRMRVFPRLTEEARACIAAAQEEARELGHSDIGTEHILIAPAADERGAGGAALRTLGLSAGDIRDDVERIVGVCGLDGDALASIGIDLDEVRRRAEETFGPGALDAPGGCRESDRTPFTPRSKKSLELALREAQARGDNLIGSDHLLLGVARVEEGVGARILAEHGLQRHELEAAIDRARRAA